MVLSGAAFALAAPWMVGAGRFSTPGAIYGSMFLSLFLVFISNGPVNAALMEAVSPSVRAFAMGLSILLLHLLGDAISPPLIGWFAQKSSFSTAVQLNALPLAMAGLVLLLGVARLGRRRQNSPMLKWT